MDIPKITNHGDVAMHTIKIFETTIISSIQLLVAGIELELGCLAPNCVF